MVGGAREAKIESLPAAPKNQIPIFYRWTNDFYRFAFIYVYVQIKSDDIPQGIIVRTGESVVRTSDKNNTNSTYNVLDRHIRWAKYGLKRGSATTSYNGGFDFTYAAGGNLPDGTKLLIIEKLIANGFTLEYSVAGTIRGIKDMYFLWVGGEVTRLSK